MKQDCGYTPKSSIKNKQNKIYKIVLKEVRDALLNRNVSENGVILIRFYDRFCGKTDEGYYEIKDLIKAGHFSQFAQHYGIFLNDVEHRCNESFDAYYELAFYCPAAVKLFKECSHVPKKMNS